MAIKSISSNGSVNTAPGTEFTHIFCAGISPLQLGVVLVFFTDWCPYTFFYSPLLSFQPRYYQFRYYDFCYMCYILRHDWLLSLFIQGEIVMVYLLCCRKVYLLLFFPKKYTAIYKSICGCHLILTSHYMVFIGIYKYSIPIMLG